MTATGRGDLAGGLLDVPFHSPAEIAAPCGGCADGNYDPH